VLVTSARAPSICTRMLGMCPAAQLKSRGFPSSLRISDTNTESSDAPFLPSGHFNNTLAGCQYRRLLPISP